MANLLSPTPVFKIHFSFPPSPICWQKASPVLACSRGLALTGRQDYPNGLYKVNSFTVPQSQEAG